MSSRSGRSQGLSEGVRISAETSSGAGSETNPAGEAAGVMSSAQAIRNVLGVVPFRRLWYSTALSSLGDWLGLLATTALAVSLTSGNSYQTQSYALGGVLVVRLLPAVLLGPLAGAFADRFDRRWTMVISDVIRFGLFLTIPLAHLVVSSDRTLAWLYISSFLIECISLFWMPAKDAAVPNLVRRDQLESRQPAQPDHDLRHHARARCGPVLGPLDDHHRAGPAPVVLPGQSGQPRAVLRRGDLPGRCPGRALHPRDQRSAT